MLTDIWSAINRALGLELESKELNIWQMSLRAIVVFIVAIAILRLGDKRFMGKNTTLDVLLGIILGSVISRAITGNAPFFPTLAASLILVLLHWTLSALAFHSHRFGTLVKGHERILVWDGEIQWHEMKKAHISEHDLQETLRTRGKTTNVREVKSAYLERSGDISVILRDQL